MVMTKAEKSARLSRLWLYRVFPLLRCIHSAVEQRAPLRRRVSHWTALGLTLSFRLFRSQGVLAVTYLLFHSRQFLALSAGIVCALSLMWGAASAKASIMLPSDLAAANLGIPGQVDHSANDPPPSASSSRVADKFDSRDDNICIPSKWIVALISRGPLTSTRTSVPNGASVHLPQAVLEMENAPPVDLQVLGRLHDARPPSLSEGVPLGLLRPPRA